jgi:hypothetical protein
MDRISHPPASPFFFVRFDWHRRIAALSSPTTASGKTIREVCTPLHDIDRSTICPYYTLTPDFTQSSPLLPTPRQQARWELQMSKRYENSNHASSCSPQKSAGYSRVGLLAWRWQIICTPLLPSPAVGQVVDQSSFPHLQWRNRAGSSPDFPVMPWWAPETDFVIPQRNRRYVRSTSALECRRSKILRYSDS